MQHNQNINDHKLLIHFIHNNDIEVAKIFIERLQKKDALNYIDENGKSFLDHALDVGAEEIATQLLELQKNTANIIFNNDNGEQVTTFFKAIKQGNIYIVNTLIASAKDAKPNTPGYKIWLQKDKNTNTALHIAAKYRQRKILKLLLQLLSDEEKAYVINFVNYKNMQGDTALHLACYQLDAISDDKIICHLIKSGGDINLTNKIKQSSFALLCQRDLASQKDLINHMLKNDLQESFLFPYKKYMEDNDKNEAIKNNYDELCTIRNIAIFKDAVKESEFSVDDSEIELSVFTQKSGHDSPKQENAEPTKKVVNYAKYQLFEQSDDSLQKLIEDLEKHTATLETLPREIISTSSLYRLALVTSLVTLLCIEFFLLKNGRNAGNLYREYEFNMTRTQYNTPKNYPTVAPTHYSAGSNPYMASSIGYVLGSVFVGLAIIAPAALLIIECWKGLTINTELLPVKVSPSEWKEIIAGLRHEIQTMVLASLQALEKENEDKENNSLPCSTQDVRDMEAYLNEFNTDNKSVSELVNTMTRLDSILKTVQEQLRKNNQPLSLLFRDKPVDTIIEINKVEEIKEDENAPDDMDAPLLESKFI